jgi:hypothetical protein
VDRWRSGAESDRSIKRLSLQGGTAQTIFTVDKSFGMSWEGDTLLLGQGRDGICRVSAEGGAPRQLFQASDGEEAHGPRLLPDGAVFYTIAGGVECSRWDDARIVVNVPGEPTPTTVYTGGADARYLPATGHVVFARVRLVAGRRIRCAAPSPLDCAGARHRGRASREQPRFRRGALQRLGYRPADLRARPVHRAGVCNRD